MPQPAKAMPRRVRAGTGAGRDQCWAASWESAHHTAPSWSGQASSRRGPAVEQRLPGYPEPAVEGGVEQPLVGARPFPVQVQSVVAGDQGGGVAGVGAGDRARSAPTGAVAHGPPQCLVALVTPGQVEQAAPCRQDGAFQRHGAEHPLVWCPGDSVAGLGPPQARIAQRAPPGHVQRHTASCPRLRTGPITRTTGDAFLPFGVARIGRCAPCGVQGRMRFPGHGSQA